MMKVTSTILYDGEKRKEEVLLIPQKKKGGGGKPSKEKQSFSHMSNRAGWISEGGGRGRGELERTHRVPKKL